MDKPVSRLTVSIVPPLVTRSAGAPAAPSGIAPAVPDYGDRFILSAVCTESDHVAPWKSVYKINPLGDTDITSMLTAGGHNAGIVSEPSHPDWQFRLAQSRYIDPDAWMHITRAQQGSWWPARAQWLEDHATQCTASSGWAHRANAARCRRMRPAVMSWSARIT